MPPTLRNPGVDHVELGGEAGTYTFNPTPAWRPDGVGEARVPSVPVVVEGVPDAWVSVIDAQAALLASIERALEAGASADTLDADTASLLALVQAMNGVLVPEDQASGAAMYARDRLHRYWLQCPYVARALAKPLGYAGDYLLMHWMYERDRRSPTRLGELLCGVYLSFPVVQAGLSRIDWLQRRIGDAIAAVDGVPRIGSLACGPAAEVAGLLASAGRPLEVVLLDQDPDALNFCAQRFAMQRERGEMHPQSSVTLRRVAVRQVLKDPDDVAAAAGTFDVLWAVGLFDYLPTPVATALVERLQRLLKPGGTLIVGNFAPHDCSVIMDTIADWRLLYRTPEELAALGPAGARLDAEPVGLMWFLEVAA